MSALAVVPAPAETTAGLSRRLAELLEQGVDGSPLPDSAREQATVLLEALRRRITRRAERDHRSLFDLDDRLIELMGMVEEAAEAGAAISMELAQEIDAYLEAYRLKVDQIVGYWRWQQSIADISGKEAERLAARKKAADNRVTRLKGFLFAFMTARGIKKLEGEKSDIGMQRNSSASLVVDDPLQVAERFFERSVRFTKTEFQEILFQLPEGDARRRLEALLKDGWEVNGESVRASLVNNQLVSGTRLVTGSHLRIR
jgi:hypothetical protein